MLEFLVFGLVLRNQDQPSGTAHAGPKTIFEVVLRKWDQVPKLRIHIFPYLCIENTVDENSVTTFENMCTLLYKSVGTK